MTRLDTAVTAAIKEVKRLKFNGISTDKILTKLQSVEDPIIRRLIIAEGLGYSFLNLLREG